MLWIGAMIMVTLDERRNGFPLPRPARLWSATGVYFILAALSGFEPLIPLANALGGGYLIILGYEYYGGTGIFAATAMTPAAPGTFRANASNPGTATGGAPSVPFQPVSSSLAGDIGPQPGVVGPTTGGQ
jgi:hypothetical protein